MTTVQSYPGGLQYPDAEYGFLVNMEGELTHLLLNKLFAEGLIVYVATEPFSNGGHDYRSGALLLRRRGNPDDLTRYPGPDWLGKWVSTSMVSAAAIHPMARISVRRHSVSWWSRMWR